MTTEPIQITEPTPTVRLRNGTDEVRPLVATTMMVLERLMAEGKGIAVYELSELAKDRAHAMWGKTGADMCASGLLTRTTVEPETAAGAYALHDSIRNIILSATEGEGLDMHLVNPIAPQPPADESEVSG